MRANQLRPRFASMAMSCSAARRIALQHTQFATADLRTCGMIRLKLPEIGALVRTSVRRIKLRWPRAALPARIRSRHANRSTILKMDYGTCRRTECRLKIEQATANKN
jgi:hypothetical protein